MSTSDTRSNGVAAQRHPTTTTPTTSNDPDAIREQIERTREELAGTVDALHAKLDVKSQAKARVARAKNQATTGVARAKNQATTGIARAKDRATSGTGKPRPEDIAGVVGAVLLAAGLIRWRRE
jgi:hypothetical protein